MKIEFPRRATVGDQVMEPGEYMISLSPESGKMVLTGKGGDYKINCTRRPSKVPLKRPRVTFGPSMGDPYWVITYFLPPRTEWVAFIRLERKTQVEKGSL